MLGNKLRIQFLRRMTKHFRAGYIIPVFILCAGSLSAAPLESGFALAPRAGAPQNERDAAFREARSRLLTAAARYENTPYRFGGTDQRGLDCSGFVYLSFRDALGVSVPRNTGALYTWAQGIHLANAQPGDLLFFRTTRSNSISHVGIYVGGRRFIHSASDGPVTGVIYSSLDESYWSRTFAGAGRAFPASSSPQGGQRIPEAQTVSANISSEVRSPSPDTHREGNVAPGREFAVRENNFIVGFAVAPTWNTFLPYGRIVRGVAGQVRVGYIIRPFGRQMILGLELRPEWDGALGITRLPVTFSWGLSDRLRLFFGPAFSFGDAGLATFYGDRDYTGGTSWIGAAGITAALFTAKVGNADLSPYGELAWQSYYRDGFSSHFPADFSAGFRVSTGLRLSWRL